MDSREFAMIQSAWDSSVVAGLMSNPANCSRACMGVVLIFELLSALYGIEPLDTGMCVDKAWSLAKTYRFSNGMWHMMRVESLKGPHGLCGNSETPLDSRVFRGRPLGRPGKTAGVRQGPPGALAYVEDPSGLSRISCDAISLVTRSWLVVAGLMSNAFVLASESSAKHR